MGYGKRYVRKRSFGPSRMRSLPPYAASLIRFGVLVIVAALVGWFTTHPLTIQRYTKQSREVYQAVHAYVTNHPGAVTLLREKAEVRGKGMHTYTVHHMTLAAAADATFDSVWDGLSGSMGAPYSLRRDPVRRQTALMSTVFTVAYKHIVLASITVQKKITPQPASVAPPSERKSSTIGSLLGSLMHPGRESREPAVSTVVPAPPLEPPVITYEEHIKPEPLPPVTVPSGPRVAFVIDDVGYNRYSEELLYALPRTVTMAILPVEYATYFARELDRRGFDVMLHLPMEAENKTRNPGPGVVLTAMDTEEIQKTLVDNLALVPTARGVNNHMGSLATQDMRVMTDVLRMLKERGLFFLDSVTAPRLVSGTIGARLGMRVVTRHTFIDNNSDPAYIRGQLEQLVALARRNGYAIGIGHYRPTTLETLAEEIPKMEESGVVLVRVRDIVEEK